MPLHRFSMLVLALAVSVVVGCNRTPGDPPQAPPTKATQEPKPRPVPVPRPPELPPEGPTKLTLPEKPPPEPWLVGRATEPSPSAAVSFTRLSPFAVTGFAVRPEVNRAVVTIKVERADKKGPATVTATRIALCDTAAGKVLTEWQVPGEHAALDMSPDGRFILVTGQNPGRNRETLRLWLVEEGEQLKRWQWVPHDVPEAGPPRSDSGKRLSAAEAVEVRWAAFVGNDRIVSTSRGGQLRVFNTDGQKAVATLDASPCRPAITPDGTKVAFLAGEDVALLDPTAGKVTHTRPLGPPPPYPVLAFSANGKNLAVGGNGKAALMDLATGEVRHVTLPKLRVNDTGTYDKLFGWAGDRHLYADHQLHDPNFPLPLWEYSGAEHGQFRGRQLWVCLRPQGTTTSTVRAFTIPHADIEIPFTPATASPGVFALKPGDRVGIDVSGLPISRQNEAKATLEGRLKKIGYVPCAVAPTMLFASIDKDGTKTGVGLVSGGAVTYNRRPARLRLVQNGRELWSEAWAVSPPFFLQAPEGQSVEAYLQDYGVGEPRYDLFSKAPLPAYVPTPARPVMPFGDSAFTADGVKDSPPR